jgi:MFS family permease
MPKLIILAWPSLTSGAFLLIFGRIADNCGQKSVFLFGMIGFTLAVLIASFASSPFYLVVFSGVIGLFSASVLPPAIGKLGAVYETSSTRKNRAFACFSAGNPLGYVGGPESVRCHGHDIYHCRLCVPDCFFVVSVAPVSLHMAFLF